MYWAVVKQKESFHVIRPNLLELQTDSDLSDYLPRQRLN